MHMFSGCITTSEVLNGIMEFAPKHRLWVLVRTASAKSTKEEKYVYPCIPQFCCIKVGYKGVYITWTCFPDALHKLSIEWQ